MSRPRSRGKVVDFIDRSDAKLYGAQSGTFKGYIEPLIESIGRDYLVAASYWTLPALEEEVSFHTSSHDDLIGNPRILYYGIIREDNPAHKIIGIDFTVINPLIRDKALWIAPRIGKKTRFVNMKIYALNEDDVLYYGDDFGYGLKHCIIEGRLDNADENHLEILSFKTGIPLDDLLQVRKLEREHLDLIVEMKNRMNMISRFGSGLNTMPVQVKVFA